jgi:acid stress chaperone HdeB
VSTGTSDRRKEAPVKRGVLAISAMVLLLSASSMAPAQVTIDVSKITCDEFLKYEIADPKQIGAWISGYYHGIHSNPILDQQKVLKTAEGVEQYCFSHPDALVMKAVEELLGTQK